MYKKMQHTSWIFPDSPSDTLPLQDPPRTELFDPTLLQWKTENISNDICNTLKSQDALLLNHNPYFPEVIQDWDYFQSKNNPSTYIKVTELPKEDKQEWKYIYDYSTDQDIYGIPNGQNKKITEEHLQACFKPILSDEQQQTLLCFASLWINTSELFRRIQDIPLPSELNPNFWENMKIIVSYTDQLNIVRRPYFILSRHDTLDDLKMRATCHIEDPKHFINFSFKELNQISPSDLSQKINTTFSPYNINNIKL